jgi:signal transduction histidine kinase
VRVRTRLVASFAYILLVVIVALTVPLALVMRDRARSELEAVALANAQTFAGTLGRDALEEENRDRLRDSVARFAEDADARVVVLDAAGIAIADSANEDTGEDFATRGRPEVRLALDSQATADVRRSDEEGGDIAVAAAPVIEEGVLEGVVRVSRGVQTVSENVGRATAAIVAVAFGGLVAGMVLALALARSLARPLSRLAGVARRLGGGDLTARAGQVEGGDEVQDLAGSFDEMASRMERTVRAQREFVANASHQLRTPLTGIKLRLEGAAAQTRDAAVADQLRAADHEVDRLAQIIQRLLMMAGEIEEGRVPHADVGDAVTRAIGRWRERAGQASSSLRGDGPGGTALADPDDVDQVLDVLIDNALRHAPGSVEVTASSNGDRVTVAVRDAGPGIPAEEIPRVTERFFRGRGAPAGGSGLGLAIARELAERWGGGLRIADGEGGGTRVEVWFRPADRHARDAGSP